MLAEFILELGVVMQWRALVDQCQNLGSHGYSSNFTMKWMKKFEEMLINSLEHKELKEMVKMTT